MISAAHSSRAGFFFQRDFDNVLRYWQHPDSPEADAEMRRRANRIEDALAAAHGGCHR